MTLSNRTAGFPSKQLQFDGRKRARLVIQHDSNIKTDVAGEGFTKRETGTDIYMPVFGSRLCRRFAPTTIAIP